MKLYDDMEVEDRTLVAQVIVLHNTPVHEVRTPAQQLYVDALKQSGMKAEDELPRTSPLVGIVENYLTRPQTIVPPDYGMVLAALQNTVDLNMEVFDSAVRIVQNLRELRRQKLPLTPADITHILAA